MQNGIYRLPPMESVVYGRPFADALGREVARLGARSVFLLASGTIARTTGMVDEVRGALGSRLVGVNAAIGAHTPRQDVVAAANEARALGAELIVTLGGGSVTDAAKMVALCLGNAIDDPAALDRLRVTITADGHVERPAVEAPSLRTIAIPTTLSAGEFTSGAGCTDTARHVKESFVHPLMMPRIVILDPRASLATPEWLFLSTGIRAVDHAVEDICAPGCQPLSEGASIQALRLLARGLPRVKADPADLDARLDCQLGAWMSMIGSQTGVPKGASHGIGHVLGGTAGVPHGYTSCVMLAPVLRFNASVNADRQRLVSAALGKVEMPAGDAVAGLVSALGLPTRLSEVGVRSEQLDEIARLSMHDRWIHTNPRKIDGPAVVRELLDAAW